MNAQLKELIDNLINEGKTKEAADISNAVKATPQRVQEIIEGIIELMDDDKPLKVEAAALFSALTILLGRLSKDFGVPIDNVKEALDEAYKMD